jgi:hypothetical protein
MCKSFFSVVNIIKKVSPRRAKVSAPGARFRRTKNNELRIAPGCRGFFPPQALPDIGRLLRPRGSLRSRGGFLPPGRIDTPSGFHRLSGRKTPLARGRAGPRANWLGKPSTSLGGGWVLWWCPRLLPRCRADRQ